MKQKWLAPLPGLGSLGEIWESGFLTSSQVRLGSWPGNAVQGSGIKSRRALLSFAHSPLLYTAGASRDSQALTPEEEPGKALELPKAEASTWCKGKLSFLPLAAAIPASSWSPNPDTQSLTSAPHPGPVVNSRGRSVFTNAFSASPQP